MPTRTLDAVMHEIAPGTTSTVQRNSWDAILFMTEGNGWSEMNGKRYDWKAWDAVHIPPWSWHRHGNDGDRPARFLAGRVARGRAAGVSGHGHGHSGEHAADLPAGIASIAQLPRPGGPSWDHLFLPPGTKERLVNHAIVSLLHGEQLSVTRGAPQGLLLFVGPSGTGKSTTARGLANAAAQALVEHGTTTLVEVDPHALPSDMLGQSQRNVVRLRARTLPDIASGSGFTVVILDEVARDPARLAAADLMTAAVTLAGERESRRSQATAATREDHR